jgi:hypothetical protein
MVPKPNHGTPQRHGQGLRGPSINQGELKLGSWGQTNATSNRLLASPMASPSATVLVAFGNFLGYFVNELGLTTLARDCGFLGPIAAPLAIPLVSISEKLYGPGPLLPPGVSQCAVLVNSDVV